LLNAFDAIYRSYEISKIRPIKGYIQVAKIVLFIVGGIVVISNLIGQNPLIILSGLGALSAVLMLIFKDSILGLVAGVQLSSNDMVRVGDWIEMPKYNADGDVIDITLNTVKVRNFDKTITMIRSYADRKSTRLNSSHVKISYAVFCLKKKNTEIEVVLN